jgi:hypothetical protein
MLPDLERELTRQAVISIECEIDRAGIATLSEKARRDNVEFAASVSDAPAPLNDVSARYLCNQAFFFLKDIAHVHRHHHHRSDTITAAYPSDRANSWVRETQYSIHRRVVALRRTPTPLNLYDALGIMAYMASFTKIATELGGKSEGIETALQYNTSEIENSIKASLESRRWNRTQFNLILTAIPALFLAMAAFLKPTLTLSPVVSNAPKTLFDATRFALEAALSPDLYGLLSVVLFFAFVPVVYGVFDPRRTIYILNIKRVITVWPRDRQVTIWLIVAGMFFLAAAYLGYEAASGVSTPKLGWSVLGGSVISLLTSIIGFPYIFTIPDLWLRLRGRDVSAHHARARREK